VPERDRELGEPFNLLVEQPGDSVVIRVSGAFGTECTEDFKRELTAACEPGPELLVLDLRGLTFIDSTGLGMVLQADAETRRRGIDFVVVRGRGQVRRVFELGGLEQRVRAVDDDPTEA
jgi:stage II sporulation protein AA (anti-sigma F factor antagonist)